MHLSVSRIPRVRVKAYEGEVKLVAESRAIDLIRFSGKLIYGEWYEGCPFSRLPLLEMQEVIGGNSEHAWLPASSPEVPAGGSSYMVCCSQVEKLNNRSFLGEGREVATNVIAGGCRMVVGGDSDLHLVTSLVGRTARLDESHGVLCQSEDLFQRFFPCSPPALLHLGCILGWSTTG